MFNVLSLASPVGSIEIQSWLSPSANDWRGAMWAFWISKSQAPVGVRICDAILIFNVL